jgi:hypothetical protein
MSTGQLACWAILAAALTLGIIVGLLAWREVRALDCASAGGVYVRTYIDGICIRKDAVLEFK